MVDESSIRQILGNIEALKPVADTLRADEDLFAKGLTSFDSVQLMLALEEHFDIEFPDHLLNRKSFSSIDNIRETVESLLVGEAA
ncbi:acyl carrier protein [Aureimonas psammosilenae]|uniref:acyl carrier protein n=1 Tax=Aureimonas psammosilenae TaxID=2495496 RepID=UPI0012611809|nr:acyl carrier protein [Aureimonas psammosilenae]